MSRYQCLALLYDALTADYNYERWVACVLELRRRLCPDAQVGRLLDLGCGTGRALALLAKQGWQATGVDASTEMLAAAQQRLGDLEPAPLLLHQDLRRLDLGSRRFDLAISLCDTLNYMTANADFEAALQGCAASLAPGGVFVFDLNTEYKLANVYGNHTYVEEGDDFLIAWENQWRPRKRICTMRLNIFTATAAGDWRRHVERHEQRAYQPDEVAAALSRAGFARVLGPFAAFDLKAPGPDTERVFYAALASG